MSIRRALCPCAAVFNGLFAIALSIPCPASAADRDIELIRPSQADPRIENYDDPNVVLSGAPALRDAPLAVFLPGTGGRPQNVLPLLRVIASQGYRVIGLSYDDEPAVAQRCPRNPDPDCSAAFRQTRSFGTPGGPVSNPPAEAIDARLLALLIHLDKIHPDDGWGRYLTGDGQLAWNRILMSGLSQGAGMAAFIAKRHALYRVVLFSSPWDVTGRDRHPAPWLYGESATPPERWWAERHAREATTDLIANAYAALKIPADHLLVFDADLPAGDDGDRGNPFHGSTVRNAAYEAQWRILYGNPAGAAS